MSSLSQQIGVEYMDQFYRGAYFYSDNKVYSYNKHLNNDAIKVNVVTEGRIKTGWATDVMSDNRIQSMDDMGWPQLGYRQFSIKGEDMGVYFISASRSAMRGLRDEFIKFSAMPVTSLLGFSDPRHFMDSAKYAKEIFIPKFTGFLDGMQMIREHKTSAFALSENLAIGISTNQAPGRTVDVFYKENVIGQVLSDNTVVVPKRIARRQSSVRLFEGKVKS